MRDKSALILVTLIAWTGWSCGPGDLEIEGQLKRVVGEQVTFSLTQGEPGFSGSVILQELLGEKKGQEFKTDRLQVVMEQEDTLSLVIPRGITAGNANALLEHSDRKGFYSIPLAINRLLLARNDKGAVEVVPLNPDSMEKSSISFRTPVLDLSISPSGGKVAILSEMQLQFRTLGAEPKELFNIEYAGGLALTALEDGVLLCTDKSLVLFRLKDQKVTQNAISINGCRAVAADAARQMAVVLHACDSDGDQQFESDCTTRITIGAALSLAGGAVILDGEVSATGLDMTDDGNGIVVVDTEKIYGIYYDPSPSVTIISWVNPATPVGIEHTQVIMSTNQPEEFLIVDEFLIAENSENRLLGVAFNPTQGNTLKKISDITLSVKPGAISLGQENLLYIADGKKVYQIAAPFNAPVLAPLELQIASTITDLAVQP